MHLTRKTLLSYGLMAFTGLLIAAAGIVFKQSFLRMLPLFVSLVVSYLQSKVSRYASLLGGLNSLLYAAVYVYYHLYASAVSAVVISCPLQLLTFLRWQKHRWRGTTQFRRLSRRQRLWIAVGSLAVWVVLFAGLTYTGSAYALLDNTATLLGVLISFLTLFAYIEYTALMVPNAAVSLIMYVCMLRETPEQTTYLIYAVYCLGCQCVAFINARRAYREQQNTAETLPTKGEGV